jgi:aminoglycoside phosphotransferase (APT) family kinase protein
MRETIYYWKCDSPHSLEQKRQSYFKEKYDRPELAGLVRRACGELLGSPVLEVAPLRADGNHIAFIVTHGERRYFFRADDGTGDDDYMLAESRLMQLAAGQGVPVPEVYHTDVSRSRCPFRFQLMACCADPCLNVFNKSGLLNQETVPRQLGQHLRRLHAIPLEGFGFINTELLQQTGQIRGLDQQYPDYFYKQLDAHTRYLLKEGLLTGAEVDDVLRLFQRQAPRLKLAQGVLVHRDMALWNVLGTPDRITAIIDWDDAVSGDPADDLGVLHCFYDEPFMGRVMQGYWGGEAEPSDFRARVWLHMLRNMLWKCVIRHSLGYFDKGGDFFLNNVNAKQTLRELTMQKLHEALEKGKDGEES